MKSDGKYNRPYARIVDLTDRCGHPTFDPPEEQGPVQGEANQAYKTRKDQL